MQKPMPRQMQTLNCHYSCLSCLFLFFVLVSHSPAFAEKNEVLVLYSWLHISPSPPPVFADWNPSDLSPCNWSFVGCSDDGFVSRIVIQSVPLGIPFPANLSSLHSLQSLVISGSNLTGTIPVEIGDCTSLRTIDLSSNGLLGSIPGSIGRLRNLEDLILNSNQLTGSIPSEIGDCINLRSVLLFDNELSGNLPVGLGKLAAMEVLRVGGNKEINGEIPKELGNCLNLTVLGLADTKVSGAIPASLGNLRNLQSFSVYTTMISGEIPPEIGNCSELVYLYLYGNSLSGSIPKELGKLQKLQKLLLWENSLEGHIPEEIGGCRSLVVADFSLNLLSGSIPWSFGNLTNLEELMISTNNISGFIPPVLANATNLVQLQLDSNQVSGSIPKEIGMLTALNVFFAWQNKLEGSIPAELAGCRSLQALDLSHNFLTGSLPTGLFQLKNLSKLLLISNDISGSIPAEIGNCSALMRLRMTDNKISGSIPGEIGMLGSLSFLEIANNNLIGAIPDEIGNCKDLQLLNLSNNSLGGALSSSISSLSLLQVLDVSFNRFSGQISASYGQLSSLSRLVLSSNTFSGSIPPTLGSLTSLEMLDLSSNNLSGNVPEELFRIEALNIALNLSWNELTGKIPPEISALNKLSALDLSHNKLEGDLMALSGLVNLVSLNISYNNFTGYLPDNKLFRQMSEGELEGNQGLCSRGHASCFLSSWPGMRGPGSQERRLSWKIKLSISLLSVLTLVLAVLGFIAVSRVRSMKGKDDDSELGGEDISPWKFTPFQKLSFRVDHVLRCLVEANMIGKGCSGIVYRVEMENGEAIAVKKLWPATSVADYRCKKDHEFRDSFSTEVKTLGSIRHKNIVRFLGCCWNQKTKLLMYDYMPNGSLGSVLHEKSGGSCLEWEVRYKIILGSAQGLAYLHHDCVPPIVHRDIKANNILIGLDFEPYIADFGIAKLVHDGDFGRSSNTVAGSYGYIAPEYGYATKITEKSDVYSYGVVVLEILTGKQPIDPTIPEGLHIVDWVRQKRSASSISLDVLDSSLLCSRPESDIEEMMQTLGVAVLCVNPSPEDRPTMKDVAAMLEEIRHGKEEYMKKVDDMITKDSSSAHEEAKESGTSGNASFSSSSFVYTSSGPGKVGLR